MLVNLSYLCVLIVIWSNILSIQPPDCLRELSIIAVISSELMAVAGTGGRVECGMVAVPSLAMAMTEGGRTLIAAARQLTWSTTRPFT